VVLTGAVVVGAQRQVPEVKSAGILWEEMYKENIETSLLIENAQFMEVAVLMVAALDVEVRIGVEVKVGAVLGLGEVIHFYPCVSIVLFTKEMQQM
jgi:hypothetical protein